MRDLRSAGNRLLRSLLLAGVFMGLGSGCTRLPEPDSPGAKLYAERCNGCHRVYAPGLMKFEMWKIVVRRMMGDIARAGLPPLTAEEETLLYEYLKKHSG